MDMMGKSETADIIFYLLQRIRFKSVHVYELIPVYSYVCSPKSPHSPNNESVDGIVTIQVGVRLLKGHRSVNLIGMDDR